MNPITYPCPCCGAPLTYGAGSKLTCASCGNTYDVDAIEAMTAETGADSVTFARPEATFDAADSVPLLRQPRHPTRPHRGRREARGRRPLRRQPGAGAAGV